MSQVSRRMEVGNHKRRSLKTRLSSGTSAGTFACPAGPYRKCWGEAGTKNEPNRYFVPDRKNGPKIDLHVSNLRFYWFRTVCPFQLNSWLKYFSTNILVGNGPEILKKSGLEGGPEPSNFEDLCLVNVSVKYFSKICFGTIKIQPELKYLKPILEDFTSWFQRAKAWEHEFGRVPSI